MVISAHSRPEVFPSNPPFLLFLSFPSPYSSPSLPLPLPSSNCEKDTIDLILGMRRQRPKSVK